MNSILATGTYVEDFTTEKGLRFMKVVLPRVGQSGADVPLYVVRNRAAGEILESLQVGAKILLSGRLYPNRNDYKMYVVPNQPIQVMGGEELHINRINLFGGVGYVEDKNEDLFIFSLMCSAPAQQILNHTWQDSLPFKLEAWGEDAKRLNRMLQKGRSVSIEGVLRYSTWQDKDGNQKGGYQVRVRSGMYGLGPAKRADGAAAPAVTERQVVIPSATKPAVLKQDLAPCSVEVDEIPF